MILLQTYCERMALELNKMNQTAEDAVKELVTIFMHRAQISMAHADDPFIDANSCKSRVT
jgi:hypothetical protein